MADPKTTKKPREETLGTQNKRLKTTVAEQTVVIENLTASVADLKAAVENLNVPVEPPVLDVVAAVEAPRKLTHDQPQATTQTVLQEPEVLHDPFDPQNPHAIEKHPPGLRLGWKNPKYREDHRGWRGWRPVSYEDDIGKNLGQYINDPPRRMSHHLDHLVRRGDSVLCILEDSIWRARQEQRTSKAMRFANAHAQDMQLNTSVQGQVAEVDVRDSGTHMVRRRMPAETMTQEEMSEQIRRG